MKSLVTLPKKMLPLRLQLFKQLLLLGSKGLAPAAAVAAPEAPARAGSVGNVLSFPRLQCGPALAHLASAAVTEPGADGGLAGAACSRDPLGILESVSLW